MKISTHSLLVASAGLLWAGASQGQATIDGDITGDGYGAALAVQGIQTQFGDNLSELNAAYAQISGGNLQVALTGNIENNFNKVILFIDSVAGGQNAIDPINNPQNFDSQIGNGLNNAWESPLGGTVFDAGFEADYAMIFRRGAGKFDFDFAALDQTAVAADEFVDIFSAFEEGPSGPLVGTNGTFEVAYDNSNVAGVAGGTLGADATAAQAVTTGIEFQVPLSAIGNPTGDIKISTWVSSGSFDFNSNQFLGSLELEDFDGLPETEPDRGNVGNFFGLDQLPGDQFFTISQGGLAADLSGDGDVDDEDLGLFFSAFTGPDNGPSLDPRADLSGDGDVDDEDLGQAFSEFTGPLGPASVPEPTSLALLGLGGLLVARRRRSS